jgi:hypothetical protein
MPKHTLERIIGPMGDFPADPTLGWRARSGSFRRLLGGPSTVFGGWSVDRRIRELVARKRAEEQR